jgi:hypothetical protein
MLASVSKVPRERAPSQQSLTHMGHFYVSKGFPATPFSSRTGRERLVFHCKMRRSKFPCLARLYQYSDNQEIELDDIVHSCSAVVKNVSEELIAYARKRSMENPSDGPTHVYTESIQYFQQKYNETVFLPQRSTVMNAIKAVRTQTNSLTDVCGDILGRISNEDPRYFLAKTDSIRRSKAPDRLEKMHIWCHPELLNLLKGILAYNLGKNLKVFIDGTFRTAPKAFKQLMILMIYSDLASMFVPIMYGLLEGKHSYQYDDFLIGIEQVLEQKLDVHCVSCDFEIGIINTCKGRYIINEDHWPKAVIVGCFFHWKQAVKRHLQDLKLPTDQVLGALESGMVDVLTIVKEDEIESTILYLTEVIKNRFNPNEQDQRKWIIYFKYFRNTWIKGAFKFADWNISALTGADAIQNRTNNALERYNRELNSMIKNNPSIAEFITQLLVSAKQKLTKYRDGQSGRCHPTNVPAYQHPEKPSALTVFIHNYSLSEPRAFEEQRFTWNDEMKTAFIIHTTMLTQAGLQSISKDQFVRRNIKDGRKVQYRKMCGTMFGISGISGLRLFNPQMSKTFVHKMVEKHNPEDMILLIYTDKLSHQCEIYLNDWKRESAGRYVVIYKSREYLRLVDSPTLEQLLQDFDTDPNDDGSEAESSDDADEFNDDSGEQPTFESHTGEYCLKCNRPNEFEDMILCEVFVY